MHEFVGILLSLGFDVELGELVVEVHIDIFVGGTVNEITRHSKMYFPQIII